MLDRFRLVTNSTTPRILTPTLIEQPIVEFPARKPTKSIGPFAQTTPDSRTGTQASSTLLDRNERRSYAEQLPGLLTILEAPPTEGLRVRIARESNDGTTPVSKVTSTAG